MKKLVIITMVIVSTLLLTACTNKEQNSGRQEIYFKNEELGSVSLTYPKSLSFSVNQGQHDEETPYLELINHDFSLNMYIQLKTLSREMLDDFKSRYTKTSYYKEYTYNGYEAYTYGDLGEMELRIILYEGEVGYTVYLAGTIKAFNNVDVKKAFNQNSIQEFLNTIQYESL